MTLATTILIVPAWSDQAGQCRLVARDHDASFVPDLKDYRRKPDQWREVGLMDSQGHLRCFDGNAAQLEFIGSCEPLMAGLIFNFPEKK